MPRKKREMIPFTDCDGNITDLPDSLTIADLVRAGLIGIRLEPEGSPIEPGWIAALDGKGLPRRPPESTLVPDEEEV